MTLRITKTDLENYELYKSHLQDYPIYANTSGLTKSDIVMLQSVHSHTENISTNKLDNDEYIEVIIRHVKIKEVGKPNENK